MYYLLNKDRVVAEFEIKKDPFGDEYKLNILDKERLPIGFRDIQSWIDNRKGSKHNQHLKKIMAMCNCENTEGFIKVTHSASINDTFWIKSDTENISWEDVSLYQNDFNETISKLAFEGIGLYGIEFSSMVPELSTEGSFRKCWRREADGIFLYKRGQDGAFNAGLEPYCEIMSSEIASKFCKESVDYEMVQLYGERATKCRLFTNEAEGYVPIAKFDVQRNIRELLKFFSEVGSEDAFRRMIILDGITFNVDRHAGNYGVLIDNDTLKPIKMAPIFDFNLAMLPYVIPEEFSDIGSKLLEYGPRIGEDFTRTAQLLLTPDIRADLVALKGFEFSFRGDDMFTEARVKKMEEMVNRQIEGILSKNILHTRDVFVPSHVKDEVDYVKESEEYMQQEKIASQIQERVSDVGAVRDVYLEKDENEDIIVHITLKEHPTVEFLFNVAKESLVIEREGINISYSVCENEYPEILTAYQGVARVLDEK